MCAECFLIVYSQWFCFPTNNGQIEERIFVSIFIFHINTIRILMEATYFPADLELYKIKENWKISIEWNVDWIYCHIGQVFGQATLVYWLLDDIIPAAQHTERCSNEQQHHWFSHCEMQQQIECVSEWKLNWTNWISKLYWCGSGENEHSMCMCACAFVCISVFQSNWVTFFFLIFCNGKH